MFLISLSQIRFEFQNNSVRASILIEIQPPHLFQSFSIILSYSEDFAQKISCLKFDQQSTVNIGVKSPCPKYHLNHNTNWV